MLVAAEDEHGGQQARIPPRFYERAVPSGRVAQPNSEALETAAPPPGHSSPSSPPFACSTEFSQTRSWEDGACSRTLPSQSLSGMASPSRPPPLLRSQAPPGGQLSRACPLNSADSASMIDSDHRPLQNSLERERQLDANYFRKLQLHEQDRHEYENAVVASDKFSVAAVVHDKRGNDVTVTDAESSPPNAPLISPRAQQGKRIFQNATREEGKDWTFDRVDALSGALSNFRVTKNEEEGHSRGAVQRGGSFWPSSSSVGDAYRPPECERFALNPGDITPVARNFGLQKLVPEFDTIHLPGRSWNDPNAYFPVERLDEHGWPVANQMCERTVSSNEDNSRNGRSNSGSARSGHDRDLTGPRDARNGRGAAEYAVSGMDGECHRQGLELEAAYREREDFRRNGPQESSTRDRAVDSGYTSRSSWYSGDRRLGYDGLPSNENVDRPNDVMGRANWSYREEPPARVLYDDNLPCHGEGNLGRRSRFDLDGSNVPKRDERPNMQSATSRRSPMSWYFPEERPLPFPNANPPDNIDKRANDDFAGCVWSESSGGEGHLPYARLNDRRALPSFGATRDESFSRINEGHGTPGDRWTPGVRDVDGRKAGRANEYHSRDEGYLPRQPESSTGIAANVSGTLPGRVQQDSYFSQSSDDLPSQSGLVGAFLDVHRQRLSVRDHAPEYPRPESYRSSRLEDYANPPCPTTSHLASNLVASAASAYTIAMPGDGAPKIAPSPHSFPVAKSPIVGPLPGYGVRDLMHKDMSGSTASTSSFTGASQRVPTSRPEAVPSAVALPGSPLSPLGWVRPADGPLNGRSDHSSQTPTPAGPNNHHLRPYSLFAVSPSSSLAAGGRSPPDSALYGGYTAGKETPSVLAAAAAATYHGEQSAPACPVENPPGLPARELPHGAMASRPSLYRKPGAAYAGPAVDPDRLRKGGLGGLLKRSNQADPKLKSAIAALNNPR